MTNHLPLPPQDYLRELFDYCPITGALTRKEYRNSQALAGEICGHVKPDGYRDVKIDAVKYYASRIIWMWMTGVDPGALYVDHKDRNRDNNSWVNLRLATRPQQMWNRCLQSKGYSFDKKKSKWYVRFAVNGKRVWGGYHDTEAEASQAAAQLRLQYQGEFAGDFISSI